ncbi:GAF domain-containing protein [Halopiger xanaduensis]|uniref:GAF domain protein n=1 Tax=Halopiger xanaduensis (strain DSM 18323 / JCM 14033 / SH-6) TaxID=797210 RepID=F8DCI1_HALXS|nr:GAF domain-containing protein [Halopiger xanaduensis]AEH36023.1 GAF domain protein [Halopiger xanaduensis SH-6]
MAHPSPRHRSRTILYAAPTEDAAREGAAALERAATAADPEREPTVHPLESIDRLRELAPDADCVVVRERDANGTEPRLSRSLLEIASACGATPLVLFTDASYASSVTRSAEGIDGYVRQGTEDAVVHLADEIDRVCHSESIDDEPEPEADDASSADGYDDDAVQELLEEHGRNRDVLEAVDEEPLATDETGSDDESGETDASSADSEPEREPERDEGEDDEPVDEAAETDRETETKTESEPEPEAATESDSNAARKAKAGTDPNTEPNSEPETGSDGEQKAEAETDPGPDPAAKPRTKADPNQKAQTDSRSTPTGNDATETATAILETAATLVTCHDRERLFELLVDGAVEILGYEYCWLSTVHFGELVPRATAPAVPADRLESTPVDGPLGEAFRTGASTRIDELDGRAEIEPPFAGVRSLCSVPVSDFGVLRVAAAEANAFDENDVVLLERLCRTAAAVLERNWHEMGVVNDRNRLEREVDRLERERDQYAAGTERLANERDRLAAERDQLLALVEDVNKPTLRYEIVDGEPVIRDVNAAVKTVFGDDPAALDGTPVDEYVVPQGLEERAATLTEALQADEQRQLLDRRETVDGVRDFMLTVVPLERAAAADGAARDGSDHAGLLVYEDITEDKRRELELAAATERLERVASLLDEDVENPLQVAHSYLELAAKSGKNEHFDAIADAHGKLDDRLAAIEDVATWDDAADTEPVALHDVARHAWTGIETGEARLVTEDDLILEANRDRLHELFEFVVRSALEIDSDGDDAAAPVTVTVGATDDGFYVAGDRPAASGTDDGRQEAPTPGRLTASDGAGLQLELVEQVADEHGWDVGVAEDEDGTAFAFRGVDAISVNRDRV